MVYRKILLAALIVILAVCAGCSRVQPVTVPDGSETEPVQVPSGTETQDLPAETDETEADETETAESESDAADYTEGTSSVPAEAEAGHVTEVRLNKYATTITVGLSDMPFVTMLPENAPNKAELWDSDNEAVASVDPYGRILGRGAGQCTVTVRSADTPEAWATVAVTVLDGENVTEPTVINGILVANKTYKLPATYNPGVDPAAQAAMDEMIAAAAADGISLFVNSSFRSFEKQTTLYNNYVGRDGKEEADRYSARPGYSEHQSGLAFDLNSLEQSFGETREGIWLAQNCDRFGFIIRYPQDKEAVTGFMYEPWHVRYLGRETAEAVKASGLCLEEYLGIDSVYFDDRNT